MKTLYYTLFFFMLITNFCIAQWMQLNPNIPGGVVRTVLVSGDTIIVGLYAIDSPDLGVYRSTDSGVSWHSLGLDNVPVWSLAKCGPYLLVGTFYCGIYRSNDWGSTWERKYDGTIIYSIVVDGSNVYAGTNGSGIIISTNQGETWYNSGPSNTWVEGGLALTDQFVFAYQSSSRPPLIRKSKNSPGWTAISSPADTINRHQPFEIFAHGSSVFIPTNSGLFVSNDFGGSWAKSDSGLPQGSVGGYFSSVGDSIICIVNGDIYLSTDTGSSWHFITSTPYSEHSTKLAANKDLLVLGTSGSGTYVSKDFGVKWNERGVLKGYITCLLSRGDVLLLGSGTGGVYASSDNGENWSPSKSGLGSAWINGFSGNESTIFAAADGGMYLSNDESKTWTQKNIGSVRTVYARDDLVFARAGSGDISGWHYSLYISTDGGDEWNNTDSLGSFSEFASNDSLLFIGSGEYSRSFMGSEFGISPPWGVYKSPTGNFIWEVTSFPEQKVTALAVLGNLVAVASTWTDTVKISYNDFHLSNDNGVNWTIINYGITGQGLDLIWLDDNLIASTSEGIFLLKSGSSTWSSINEGLNDTIVGSLTVHNNELFLIGTSRTIWHRPISEITDVTVRDDNFKILNFLLEQNYPNPFNPTTTIRFSVPKKSNVRLNVLNIIGEEVAVLLNEEKDSGYHSVEFIASNFPSGIYFYRLTAGNFISTKKMMLIK